VKPLDPHWTRRLFLQASATALAAGLRPPPLLGATDTVVVPFVGEGAFPLERVLGAGLGRRRSLDLSTLAPDALVVPEDRFFIRTGSPDPLPPAAGWRIRVGGLVEAPRAIPIEELRAEAADEGLQLLECAGNSRNLSFGLMGVARWKGVRLERLVERARPRPRATRVLVSGYDEHGVVDAMSVPGASWVFGLDEIRQAGAFLATEQNGAPLTPDHGRPVRLVVPGWYACTAIKWVNEIELVDDDAPATGQMKEYAGRTLQDPGGPRDLQLIEAGRRPEGPPLARDFKPATVDPAALPVRVERIRSADGSTFYRVVGIVWGGPPRGAAARGLRIRIDPGILETAVEEVAESSAPWTLWSHRFEPKRPGRYRIRLAFADTSVRARKLDAGFYAREIEVSGE
jgi:DMSO/TMAO reductase YedYZ molybdopterin-dependent catalytic subunit